MKRNKSPKPFKVVGKGGRRKNPETEITLKPTLGWPAKQPVAQPADPEREHAMTRQQALAMFEPLPVPRSWTIYAEAPIGEVAAAIPGNSRIMRAALLLHELEIASLAQRRTEIGTEYLIRRYRR